MMAEHDATHREELSVLLAGLLVERLAEAPARMRSLVGVFAEGALRRPPVAAPTAVESLSAIGHVCECPARRMGADMNARGRAVIESAVERFRDAYNSGNVEVVAAYYSDSLMKLRQGAPAEGKAEVVQRITEVFRQFRG